MAWIKAVGHEGGLRCRAMWSWQNTTSPMVRAADNQTHTTPVCGAHQHRRLKWRIQTGAGGVRKSCSHKRLWPVSDAPERG